jgi:hypothetical protein
MWRRVVWYVYRRFRRYCYVIYQELPQSKWQISLKLFFLRNFSFFTFPTSKFACPNNWPPKRRYVSTRPHGFRSQKATNFIVRAAKSSNVTKCTLFITVVNFIAPTIIVHFNWNCFYVLMFSPLWRPNLCIADCSIYRMHRKESAVLQENFAYVNLHLYNQAYLCLIFNLYGDDEYVLKNDGCCAFIDYQYMLKRGEILCFCNFNIFNYIWREDIRQTTKSRTLFIKMLYWPANGFA